MAAARQQGPEHKDRRAHRLDQIVRRLERRNRGRIELDLDTVVKHDFHTHLTQQFDAGRYVVQVRDVGQDDGRVGQQRGRQYRQCGILRARDAHVTREPMASCDDQFVHAIEAPARRVAEGPP